MVDGAQRAAQRALVAAMNHVLSQHPESLARLRRFHGRTVAIGFDRPAPMWSDLIAVIQVDGRLGVPRAESVGESPASHGPADVRIVFRPSLHAALEWLREGSIGARGHVRAEGESALATLLGELAAMVRWDPEDDLSRLVGDAAANRIGNVARDAVLAGRELLRRLGMQASAALTETSGPLAPRHEFEECGDSLERLARRLDELERRARQIVSTGR